MEEISLIDFTKYILRNWLVIVGFTILGLVAGYSYNTFIQKPLYRSSATILLLNKTEENISTASLVNNYAELFKSRSVLEAAAERQDYTESYESLLANTTSKVSSGTEVVNVSIATFSPQVSRGLMVAAIEAFQDRMVSIYGVDNLEIVDDASLPAHPYNVNTSTQLALAAVAGLILSLLILFFAFDYKSSGGSGRSSSDESEGKGSRKTSRKTSKDRKSNNIILGDDDDLDESFLFDDSILDQIATDESKSRPIKKPGSKMRVSSRK